MGMLHDFDDAHSGKDCDGKGFMSYGTFDKEWSSCSKADLLARYNEVESSSGTSWCLPGK